MLLHNDDILVRNIVLKIYITNRSFILFIYLFTLFNIGLQNSWLKTESLFTISRSTGFRSFQQLIISEIIPSQKNLKSKKSFMIGGFKFFNDLYVSVNNVCMLFL